ncbi:MAG: FAD-dependent oxidoreductase [Lachnospiraceae bacterium]|nr:FAD-dependent oxidoreductase [Lachnospiraceae bacterium]
MSNKYYPHLFEPIRLRKQLFRCRIFASPQDFANLTSENFLTDEAIAFYEMKARGGFASVCVGDCIVDSEYGHNHQLKLKGDVMKSKIQLSRCASAITRHGAVANIELNHAGKYAFASASRLGYTYGPVDEVINGVEVRAMTEDIIEHIIKKYALVAAFVRQNGFGMINIHAGHGWLLTQFMDPGNTRTDKWGGSLENRMRLPLAVVDAVRKAVGPAFPIEFRFSADELIPGGYGLDQAIEMAKMLDGKVDLFNVSVGHHETDSASCVTHPSMFLEDGCNVKYAAAIKKNVKETPVECIGALTDVNMMEELIASGTVDVVQLGRQSLADPELPNKARTGRADDITRCMRCVTCFHSSTVNGFYRCAVNPVIGNELNRMNIPEAKVKKTVLVAGGGIGGMQAAITANQQGHKVILLEKSDKLGGTLLCEKDIPFKQRLDDYLTLQTKRVMNSEIEVHLNTAATPESVAPFKPDVIIAALGARPVKPTFIKGIDGDNVMGAEEVYYHPEKAGKRIVIIGGGLVGAELGIYMADTHKRDVTIIEMLDHIAGTPTPCKGGTLPPGPEMTTGERMNELVIFKGDNVVHDISIREKMKTIPNIRCYANTAAREITPEGLIVKDDLNGEYLVEADTVVYAVGQMPQTEAAYALADCAREFYPLGDCVAPRNIMAATQAAEQVALDIGRQ